MAPQKTITEAATNGTTRELLVAVRTRLAEAVESPRTLARDLAALTRRLAEVQREIEALNKREAPTPVAADDSFDPTTL